MKDLLRHLKTELFEELNAMESGDRLRLIYQDLLRKTDMALEELEDRPDESSEVGLEPPFAGGISHDPGELIGQEEEPEGENLAGNDQSSSSPEKGKVGLNNPFDRFEEHEHTFEPEEANGQDQNRTDEHHAQQDGGKESFEDLKERIESFTATDLDPDRLRELANVAEEFEEPVDPRDMSDNEFGKIVSRLRPNLIDWATGKKEVEKLDKTEIASEIQNALHRAQQESDGNIDMLRSFQEYVSDSIFDTSQNMGDDYVPEDARTSGSE